MPLHTITIVPNEPPQEQQLFSINIQNLIIIEIHKITNIIESINSNHIH